MTIFLIIHIITAIVGLGLGAVVLSMSKGTKLHRRIGMAYFAAMFITNISIMPVTARVMPLGGTTFGIFHILALVSLASLMAGGLALIRWHKSRDPEHMRSHQMNMGFSYLGLIMAAASEIIVNPRLGVSSVTTASQFWTLLAIVNITLYAGGSVIIMSKLRRGDPLRFFARANVPSSN
jgi:uncharacterized membrane protein